MGIPSSLSATLTRYSKIYLIFGPLIGALTFLIVQPAIVGSGDIFERVLIAIYRLPLQLLILAMPPTWLIVFLVGAPCALVAANFGEFVSHKRFAKWPRIGVNAVFGGVISALWTRLLLFPRIDLQYGEVESARSLITFGIAGAVAAGCCSLIVERNEPKVAQNVDGA